MNGKRSSFTASSRWLIALPAVFLALFPNTAHADTEPGLAYTVYDNWTGQWNAYNQSPPLPPTTPIVDSGISDNIDYGWGGGPILASGIYEDVVVRWIGWIDPPIDQTYYLCAASDDGFKLYLDGVNVINDWYDRGGGCGETADVDFSDGEPKELLAWYYENGGGAHAVLLYYTGSGWSAVPDDWYYQTEPSTTTTEASTTTVGETTTTEAETTTTSSSSTTSPAQAEEQKRQDEARQTYEKETECEKVNHAFESCPLWPGRTTSLPPTTTAPPPETLPPSTPPSYPDTTLPLPTPDATTGPTVPTIPRPPVSTQVSRPDLTVPPTVPTATTVAEASPPLSVPAVDTSLPTQPLTPVVPQPEQRSSAQVTDNPTPAEAAAVATDAQTVAQLSVEEAEQVFAALEVAELSEEQVAELVAAVQQAPTSVRKQFEDKVDIFGEGLDDYVPTGSNIPVGERRTLVAVGGLIMAAGASIRVRR